MDVVIYHNPDCGTSRNTLAMIRNAGIEPHVIEYLKCPPSRTMLEHLITRMGITPQVLLREKGTPYAKLGLGDPSLAEAGIDTSVGSVGDSYDNALAESIIGLFKTEVIKFLGPWKSVGQVEWETLKWVDWYNKTRLHSAIGYVTPNEAEEEFYTSLNAAAKAA